MNCPYCRNEIKDENQNYCEICGHEIMKVEPEKSLNLLDNTHKFYIMTTQYWNHGSGHIYNGNGEIIGSVQKKGKIIIRDFDESVIAMIISKSLSLHHKHILRDSKGDLIAEYKKKMVTNFRSIYYLTDRTGNRKFEAYGEFMDFNFNVRQIFTEKIVAEFDKAEKWKNQISEKILKHYDSYALKINELEVDRLMILGFVLASKYIIYDVF